MLKYWIAVVISVSLMIVFLGITKASFFALILFKFLCVFFKLFEFFDEVSSEVCGYSLKFCVLWCIEVSGS